MGDSYFTQVGWLRFGWFVPAGVYPRRVLLALGRLHIRVEWHRPNRVPAREGSDG